MYRAISSSTEIERRCRREGVHRITLSPFGAAIYVFKGVESYPGKLRRIFGIESTMSAEREDEVGGFFGTEQNSEGYSLNVLVISTAFDDYPEEFIWHEALHATCMILDVYGVEFDPDNHEVYTYTQAFIVSQIRQHLYGLEGFGR